MTGSVRPAAEIPTVDEAEVLVVGAGPAGSSAAALLAERGHDVLLVDQSSFPRDKPCGDGLTRPSVRFLDRLGLAPLLSESQPVAGVRLVYDHGRTEVKDFSEPARCTTRLDLDHALLGAARERGARFLQGRVDGPLMVEGTAEGVVIGQAGAHAAIRARCVVAADGATSRLRRECGFGRGDDAVRGYAVRQYCTVDRPLEPLFDVFVPLEVDGRGVVGYGWVFPIGERLANVGVGIGRIPRDPLGAMPSLRRTLASFVDELRSAESDRYGRLEPASRPFGSPLGVGFSPDRCQFQRILFVGDAALTTDPLTGEGIAYALQGGELVADAAHRALTGGAGARWHEDLDVGRRLGRRFLRLGQDLTAMSRVWTRHLAREEPAVDVPRSVSQPFLDAAKRTIVTEDVAPAIEGTPIATFAAQHDDRLVAELEHVNAGALDELQTGFPFATEMLHRELRSGAGPAAAAALLLGARLAGREPDPPLVSAAIAVELLALFPVFAAQVVERAVRRNAKLNNVLAVLVADFVVTRAVRRSVPAGGAAATALSDAACAICEGEMVEVGARWDVDRSPESCLKAAELSQGSLFTLAIGLGAELGGSPTDEVAALREAGRELGIAVRISDDVCDLLEGDSATGREMAAGLQQGHYSLPVVCALSRAGSRTRQRRKLVDPANRVADTVGAIERLGGVADALAECSARAEAARAAMAGCGVDGPLAELTHLPVARAAAAAEARHALPIVNTYGNHGGTR